MDGQASLGLFILAYLITGYDVVGRAIRNIFRGQVFDENFLMTIATLSAFYIQEYPEAVAVMLFYQVGEVFQDIAISKSRRSIADLMDIRPDYANLVTGNNVEKVAPEAIKIEILFSFVRAKSAIGWKSSGRCFCDGHFCFNRRIRSKKREAGRHYFERIY